MKEKEKRQGFWLEHPEEGLLSGDEEAEDGVDLRRGQQELRGSW